MASDSSKTTIFPVMRSFWSLAERVTYIDMNLVTLECPLCRGMIQVDAASGGQQVACPLCRGMMQVPALDLLAAIAQPPPPPAFASPPPTPPAVPPPMPRPFAAVPMELMSLSCPSCGGMFQVPPSAAGMQLPCPTCRQMVTIPDAAPASMSATPSFSPRQATPEESEPLESLLPPGAADPSVVPQSESPLPAAPRPVLVTAGPVDANPLAVRNQPKFVGQGMDQVEIRRLTAEEKARRRAVRNVILFVISVAILLAFVVYKSRS